MSKKAPAARAKYFADQMDDEDVLFVFRKHPVVMRKGLVISMVALLLGQFTPWRSLIFTLIAIRRPASFLPVWALAC